MYNNMQAIILSLHTPSTPRTNRFFSDSHDVRIQEFSSGGGLGQSDKI